MIEPGDLCLVVHVCCAEIGGEVGHIFTAEQVMTFDKDYTCRYCGGYLFEPITLVINEGAEEAYPVQWLRRIPPLSELEERELEFQV